MAPKTSKKELYRLVDVLPESELHAAKRFLEYLRSMSNPVVRAMIEAPEDDETTTPEEDQGAKEAWQEHLRGDSVSAEEAKRELLS